MDALDTTDPMSRLQRGITFHSAGLYRDALKEYLWCFEHGCDNDNSFSAVRVSFLLGYMVNLGNDLPESIHFLEGRRRLAECGFFSGIFDFSENQLFFALNRELHKPELSILAIAHQTINHKWRDDCLLSALRLITSELRFWNNNRFNLSRCGYTIVYGVSVLLQSGIGSCQVLSVTTECDSQNSREIVRSVRQFVEACVIFLLETGQIEKSEAVNALWKQANAGEERPTKRGQVHLNNGTDKRGHSTLK